MQRRFNETSSEGTKAEIQQYMYESPCPACHGKRYRPETLAVKLNGVNIAELSDMSIFKARDFLNHLELNSKQKAVAERVLKRIECTPELPCRCWPRLSNALQISGYSFGR